MKALLFLLVVSVTSTNTIAQQQPAASVKGKVVDSISASALASASIIIFSIADEKQVEGTLAGDSGQFTIPLPYGSYYAVIDFMGYISYRSKRFLLSKEDPIYDFGTIPLLQTAGLLDEVVVQAEKSSMQLALDKKIFNVGRDLANAGGSASDILTNIPSVSVDPEGNVKLRGSDNVRILIDGKPSGLVSIKGGSGLQQLQASMVDRVEIITNPSARYEAEGMAGIINIILKKDRKEGFNGTVELVSGTPTNLGAALNFNYRRKKMNFFINYGIAYRKQPNVGSLYQEVYANDTTFLLQQKNNGTLTGFNNNIRGGLDYYFTEKSILTGSYLYRRSKGNRLTDIRYEDYLFTKSTLTGTSKRRQEEDETEPNSEYSLSYKKSFAGKGNELIAEVKYLDYWENSDQTFTQSFFDHNGTENPSKAILQKSLNDEFEKQWLFQLDYIKPIGEEGKFETGARSSFRNMVNDYIVTERDASGNFVPLPGLDNIFGYDENIHAAYGILGNKTNNISYQGGLRAEWTDVTTILRKTNETNPRDYVNLFPSAHITFELKNEHGIQLSYSRRVRRPFYNDLSPFVTFSDSRNFFSGNPDLDPEFSNVMEVGHIKSFNKGSFTSSIYYRSTKGKIDRIRIVSDEGNSVTRPENLLSEDAFGFEFTSAYSPWKWWKLDFNANFFHAAIDGTNIMQGYKANTYSWFARQTSRFMLPKNIDLQLRTNYEAPQKTAQGKRKALYYADLSASKDIFKGKGTANLNVLDLFNTRRMRSITNGPNFYSEGDFQFRRRQINFTISYRIRQEKQTGKPKSAGLGDD
ncbi:TonB-dependent receptor domain-containing protein [Flavihumibacter sp. ZG627]|uniref:TonB-dependent receptor domain-containing protein n=1 Tax=Flavihumibacter sp. ZG627 TaxID=1463156 RepID=UPI00057E9FCE|nr:TonB-dependent receptor [Flavihumibacter sp. ZG627]KIC89409.1 TonB-dependent receptor [Flavihumibacter sp. ZG627]